MVSLMYSTTFTWGLQVHLNQSYFTQFSINLSITTLLSLSPAENLASKYNISREEQDEYACESQLRVKKATEAGFFKDEIVPVSVKGSGRNAQPVLVAEDEFPQKNTSVEILSKLRPAFKKVNILSN